MSDALVIALILALLVAVGAVVALARRKPVAPPPAVDEDSLRRLLDEAVSRSASEIKPAAEPDLGRFALLSHEAQAAAEAADAVRRTAAEAAEELSLRTRRDAEQLRQDAQAEAQRTIAAARAQAAELRAGLESERTRIASEATAALAQDRKELQEAEQRLRAATQALADEQHALVADRRRIGSESSELASAKRALEAKATALAEQEADLRRQAGALDQRERDLAAADAAREAELVRISGLTVEAARAELLAGQEEAVRRDAAMMIRRIESEAQNSAKQRARAIVAEAIQRVASDQTAQTVVAVVHLPADEVKGRIIGREGRNIRAFETVTGVNVIIDDTPEAVLLSCFDPVRREIGRITLEMLIDDGRIHPHRIEEAFERARDEVDVLCRRAAEDAMLDVRITDLHPELVALVGRLKYRTSYGQNVLGHLVETAHIARAMAAELGIDPTVVTRGAFLHDIGKALTHEVPGSHALIGADLARKYGESDEVVHCIEAHHDEVAPSTVEAVLTQAADACSGGRPGARRESLESYVQRLERIEAIAGAKKGVEKVFAMQAGRELRVMVKPDIVDDVEAHILAREVAKQIEEELTYPGQVRVTVIRESRATEIAR
ncbi:MAG TPA: ribonuclease Y [Nakamurella multipartita]|nr:ribonuclease Y [Nakamurella multipartita]